MLVVPTSICTSDDIASDFLVIFEFGLDRDSAFDLQHPHPYVHNAYNQ